MNLDWVRPEISESWQRSLTVGINPYSTQVTFNLDEMQLEKHREAKRELLEISGPIMKNLYHFVQGSGFIVSLIDQNGIILESVGDQNTCQLAAENNLVPGACMSETCSGTNATGLALYLQRPVQVLAAEHFMTALHAWTCSAGPIRDHAGKLTGALSMTGTFEKVHSHTLGMVVAAIDSIEGQLKVNKALDNLMVITRYQNAIVDSISEGLIAVDQQGIITRLNSAAGRILRVNIEEGLRRPVEEVLGESNPVRRALLSGVLCADEEFQADSQKGKIHCTITCQPIRNPQQKVVGVVAIMREIKLVRQLVQRMVGARAKFTFDDLVGKNAAYLKTVQLANTASNSSSNVLLLGESGTGKEVFAQAIHNASARANEPFIAINCAALPRDLIGSELFGYTDGAFTGAKKGGNTGKFELADGGTIFLDEIGEMPLEMQANLLRVLQEKALVRIGGQQVVPVDVRVIAATNRNLMEEVEKKNFRSDLYYRLNVLSISMVPLRQRKDDLLPLASFFIEKINRRMGRQVTVIHAETLDLLQRYHWPGNVRELENVIERAINVASGEMLTPDTLPDDLFNLEAHLNSDNLATGRKNLVEENSKLEQPEPTVTLQVQARRSGKKLKWEVIRQAIDRNEGNLTHAAKELGISRSTLYRKLEALNVELHRANDHS
ncbi:MAG: sigma 54-interacting transcriptional regulator [Carboxydocellales bacterium]